MILVNRKEYFAVKTWVYFYKRFLTGKISINDMPTLLEIKDKLGRLNNDR